MRLSRIGVGRAVLLRRRLGLFALCPAFFVLFALSAVKSSAVQQAWVQKYNHGPNTTNQAVAMALDNNGNIYVAGHSTRTNAPYDFDYVVIKYNPLGIQQWVSRYGVAAANDQVRAMVANTNGEVFITGTTETLKYLSDGSLAWNAPYSGRGIALDTNGNCYVTGFLTNDFSTAKIDPFGSNVWLRVFDYIGDRDFSQRIAVNTSGDVFVGGLVTWFSFRVKYLEAHIVKYDSEGNLQWSQSYGPNSLGVPSEYRGFACDDAGDFVRGCKPARQLLYLGDLEVQFEWRISVGGRVAPPGGRRRHYGNGSG